MDGPLLAERFLSAEFSGKARLIERAVAAADDEVREISRRMMSPLRARFRRNPVPREELLAGARYLWEREMPQCGSIYRYVKRAKLELHILEYRLVSCGLRLDHWDTAADEPGLGVALFCLSVAPGHVRYQRGDILAFVGHHALGRWSARAFTDTPQGLQLDLMRLLARRKDIVADVNSEEFVIPTNNGGAWRGRLLGGAEPPCLVPGLSPDPYAALMRVQSFY